MITKFPLILSILLALSACSTTQTTRVMPLADDADAPYSKVLVIALFESFDSRRYLENDIVREIKARGADAVASTSLMNTKTPVTRETFLAMVDSEQADAVIVTRLVNLETQAKMKDASPEATYKVSPTYYYNVFSVELDEYVAPQNLQLKHSLVLATEIYSAATKEPVWGIESKTKLTMNYDDRGDLSVVADEAKSIANHLAGDGLIAR
jgi:hypothetical protein